MATTPKFKTQKEKDQYAKTLAMFSPKPTVTATTTKPTVVTATAPKTTSTKPKIGPAPAPTAGSQYTSQQVKNIQDQLVKEGYMTQAQVDTGYGTYGPKTTAAVAKYEADKKVNMSGLIPAVKSPVTSAPVTSAPVTSAPVTTDTQTDTSELTQSQKDLVQRLTDMGIITKPTTPAPETTPSELLGYIPQETETDKKIREGEDAILKIKEELAKPETDEAMRARLTALFQQEIDALNAVYAQQKQEAIKAGMANLGTNRAQQARFGLLGSSFGTAETKGIEEETTKKQESIDVAKGAALAPIYSKISEEMIAAKKEKATARMTSAEAYVANLKSQKEKKAAIATNAIKNMILNKANPTEKDFQDMARQIGIDPALFKQEYQTVKSEEDANKAALDIKNAKASADMTQPKDVGDYTYQYNPQTGLWENIGLNKKAVASGEMSTRQNVVFNSIITKNNAIDTANATFNVAKATAARVKADPKNAQAQLSNLYEYVKTLDANSAVREGEIGLAASTGSLKEQLQRIKEKYIDEGTTVGSDLAIKMADEAIALSDAWLRESQRQKNNLRAQAMTNGIESEYLKTVNYAQELNSDLDNQNSVREKIVSAGYDYDAIKKDNPDVSDEQLLSDLGIK